MIFNYYAVLYDALVKEPFDITDKSLLDYYKEQSKRMLREYYEAIKDDLKAGKKTFKVQNNFIFRVDDVRVWLVMNVKINKKEMEQLTTRGGIKTNEEKIFFKLDCW